MEKEKKESEDVERGINELWKNLRRRLAEGRMDTQFMDSLKEKEKKMKK